MTKAMKATPVVINATQHVATPEQQEAGVIMNVDVKELLTFNEIPTLDLMLSRASAIAEKVLEAHWHACEEECLDWMEEECIAMIGGAPYFMSVLETVFSSYEITPVYAFSKRESVDKVIDGQVVKTSVFKHLGFVRAEGQTLMTTN